jgi:outer membrane protein OmpA-like peptidoglycan-associated protein
MKTRTVHALLAASLLAVPAAAQSVNLLALGEGALPVVEAPCYSGWPAANLLDDSSGSGWASEEGRIRDNVFVFELPAVSTLEAFEFDTASIDGDGRGARDVTVEVSATARDSGFQKVLQTTLQDRADGQRFAAQSRVAGRFVRLTLADNHGDAEYSELMGFRGYGARPQPAPALALQGTFHTDYSDFHLRQQGTALTGCYEYNEGLFEGAVEGRVMKLTWHEGASSGPAVFVFAPDGRSFHGFWWRGTDRGRAPDGSWDGTRAADTVGSCPNWSGSLSGELEREIRSSGRARLYGILFDTDSAAIRSESFGTLDEVAKLLAAEPSWKLTIEGHTDSTGTAAHNQTLSEQRARSVRDYLVAHGVDAGRLATAGFGQSKPVADNDTELGRARNRRVELVRN